MNSFIKALLAVAGIIFLLVVAIGGGGYLWLKHNKTALLENGKAVIEEGSRFGTHTDNAGCLEEAVARIKNNGGLKNQIKVGLFFRGCLKAAKPSPQFCDNVPPETEIMKSASWRIQMSEKYGLKDKSGILFQNVQKYCDECRKKTE